MALGSGISEKSDAVLSGDATVFPQFSWNSSQARYTAIAAGDLRAGVLQEVTNILSANKGNPLQATKVGLDRLQSKQLISVVEQRALSEICDVLFSAQRSKISREQAIKKIRVKYKEMLADEKSSPVALAIASMSAGDASTFLSGEENLTSEESFAYSRAYGGDLGMVAGAAAGAV
jgi:hypothetical protein